MIAIIQYEKVITLASMAPGMPTMYGKDTAAKEWQTYKGEYVLAKYCKVIKHLDVDDMDVAVKEYPELLI